MELNDMRHWLNDNYSDMRHGLLLNSTCDMGK